MGMNFLTNNVMKAGPSIKNLSRKYSSSLGKHATLSTSQKYLLTVGSSVICLMDPWRHDLVAVLGETTGLSALRVMYKKMQESQEGQEILRDRPVINTKSVDMKYLRSLPGHSIGGLYARFMERNKISADTRFPVQFIDDPDLAYVMQRYRETHDLVHAVVGMDTNMLGEVCVKWIEGVQTGLPMCLYGGLFGAIRLKPKQRAAYVSTHLPWCLRVGKNADFLMNIYYEKRWIQNIDDFRAEWNIEPVPS